MKLEKKESFKLARSLVELSYAFFHIVLHYQLESFVSVLILFGHSFVFASDCNEFLSSN